MAATVSVDINLHFHKPSQRFHIEPKKHSMKTFLFFYDALLVPNIMIGSERENPAMKPDDENPKIFHELSRLRWKRSCFVVICVSTK